MNAPAAIQEQTKCPFCDKQGLPILPVRYAIGRVDKGQNGKPLLPEPPPLGAQFGEGVSEIGLPQDSARYTLRLLREGYLYVFNEKRGQWYAYVVTPAGYLYEFDFNDPSPPLPRDIEFSCVREGDDVIARCITVTDAQTAGRIWLGFSEVLWTNRVKELHKKEDWRRKHMRCIDLQAWRGKAPDQPHVAPMTDIQKLVAEYSVSPKTGQNARPAEPPAAARNGTTLATVTVFADKAFSFSPFDFHRLGDEVSGLIEWAQKAAKPYRPIVTALWDPPSILMELDRLMQARYQAFTADNPERQRKMAVSCAIMSLRQAVGTQAEDEALRAAETAALNVSVFGTPQPGVAAAGGMGGGPGAMALGKILAEKVLGEPAVERYKSLEKAYANVSEAELDRVGRDAWQKYERRPGGSLRYNEAAREAFQKAFDAELRVFDEGVLTPLAMAHRDWMASERMAKVYEANYDESDERSGDVYAVSIALCVGNTQDKKACFDLYKQWLLGEADNRRNLLLRALTLNRPHVLEKLKEFKEKGVDLWSLSWPSLIKSYDFSTQRSDAIAHLILRLGGPIAAVLSRVTERPAKTLAILLGMVSRRAIVPVEMTGNRRAFNRKLIKAIRDSAAGIGKETPSRRAMLDPIELELKRLEARGMNMSGSSTKEFFIAVDPNHIAAMPSGLTKQQRCRWLASSLKLSDELRLLDLPGALRRSMNTEVRVGAVGAVLDALLLWKLWADSDDTMAHKMKDNRARLVGGIVGVVGGGAETIGKYLEARGQFSLQFGRGVSRLTATWIKGAGLALSLAGGVVVAIADSMEGFKEIRQNNVGVGILYLISASAGAVLALAAAFSATGIGIAAAIVLLLVSALLAWFVDNPIQDWLERCYWGTLTEEKYKDMKSEMAQLELAVKG